MEREKGGGIQAVWGLPGILGKEREIGAAGWRANQPNQVRSIENAPNWASLEQAIYTQAEPNGENGPPLSRHGMRPELLDALRKYK